MTKDTNKFEEDYEKMLNDSHKDKRTKLELSKAFLESINFLIEDWILAQQVIKKGIKKLEIELQNEESGSDEIR